MTTDSVLQRALSNMLTEIFDGPPGQEAYLLNPGDPGLIRQLDDFLRLSLRQHFEGRVQGLTAHGFGNLLCPCDGLFCFSLRQTRREHFVKARRPPAGFRGGILA